MASTMDAISGGRMELGIGAGWKREEWLAYGYGFPETAVRLAMLHDALEVISRMLEPGKTIHATYEGAITGWPMRATCRSRSRRTGCRSWSVATART